MKNIILILTLLPIVALSQSRPTTADPLRLPGLTGILQANDASPSTVITDGSSGDVLTTDGAGAYSFSGTITGKTLTSPVIDGTPSAASATWSNLGQATTIDINGGTIDGTIIGGSTRAAGSFTTVNASTNVSVVGTENSNATLILDADEGDDPTDTWIIRSAASDNDLDFLNNAINRMSLSSGGNLSAPTLTTDTANITDLVTPSLVGTYTGSSASTTIQGRYATWGATAGADTVASILLQSGSDTGNKDDGQMAFQTQASNAGGLVAALTISSNGSLITNTAFTSVSSGSEQGWIWDRSLNVMQISRNNVPVFIRRTSGDGDIIRFFRDTDQVGSVSVTTTATAYNTSSDRRLKENIRPTEKGIEELLNIQVHDYKWKSTGGKGFGFVAQELNEIAPYAVTKGETEEDMWSVDNSKLVPLLVKSIQDQQQEIENLKTEIENLKKKK